MLSRVSGNAGLRCFLVLVLTAAAACADIGKYGGTLVMSAGSPPKSFNPIVAKEASTTAITGYIFEGLTTLDAFTLQVKPNLATRWEHDSTGTVWTFHLRRDVVWNDGVPFTASDVVFTFEKLIFNDEIPTSSRDVFLIGGKKLKVKALDRYTVRFTLPDRFAPFLMLCGQEILPEHVYSGFVENHTFNFSMGLDSKPADIVGTGAFMLEDFRPGEYLILKRNPRYWKKDAAGNRLPYLDRIVYLITPDQNLALLKFRKGEIDAISLRAQDYLVLRKAAPSGVIFFNAGPSLGSEFIVFNQNLDAKIPGAQKQWFRNVWFRRAVSCAIDRQAIVRNIFAGLGYPLYGPVSESVKNFYNPAIPRYPYDIEKAKQYLAKAGFKIGSDGFLRDSNGNIVSFSLITNSNNSERIQECNFIRNDLEKLGIRVNFLPVEFNSLVTRLNVTGDWESVMIGLTGGVDPHSGKNVWSTTGQLHLWNSGSRRSIYDWETEVDRIFDEGARELDPVKRKKLYDRWQEIVCDNLPVIFTTTPAVLYAVKDKFGNLKPSVYGGLFHNIEEIYLKKLENGRK